MLVRHGLKGYLGLNFGYNPIDFHFLDRRRLSSCLCSTHGQKIIELEARACAAFYQSDQKPGQHDLR